MCLSYLGTDATHAEHIETIKNRSYVGVRPDGRFVPGHLGMGLVEGRQNHFVKAIVLHLTVSSDPFRIISASLHQVISIIVMYPTLSQMCGVYSSVKQSFLSLQLLIMAAIQNIVFL